MQRLMTAEFVTPRSEACDSLSLRVRPATVPVAVAVRRVPLKWSVSLIPSILKRLLVTPRTMGPWPVQVAVRSMVVGLQPIRLRLASNVQAVAGRPDALVLALASGWWMANEKPLVTSADVSVAPVITPFTSVLTVN